MTTVYDITATKGANLRLRFTAKDAAGSPVNLTDYTASGYVRLKYSSTGVLLDLMPSVHSSYVSGWIDVDVPASGLADLPITQAVYDINIYHTATGYIAQAVRGLFNISPAATY